MKHRLALATGLLAAIGALGVPAPATAAAPTMRLSDVRPGMRCTALSVVRATTISRFDVEVIDVLRGDPASSGPRILVRVSGPAVDATGVGPGFSGSPILCPDSAGVMRNAGAISETVGEFGGKVALATPIGLILGQGARAPRGARRAPALMRSARKIATPLTISGLTGAMRIQVLRAARRTGRPIVVAPSAPSTGFPVQRLEPGSAVATSLASGDVSISALGTVTYRDGASVWGFGHPFEGFGRRALLLQDAYIFSVINNPLSVDTGFSYKLGVPGHTVGTLTNDTLNAIVGRVGPRPRTIGFRATVRDLDRRRSVTVRSRVTDERALDLGSALALTGTIGVGQALVAAMESAPPRMRSSMCLRIRVRERRSPMGFCNDYEDGERPFEDLSTALVLIDAFKYGRLTPISASVHMRVRRGVPEALMLGASAPKRVRPGQRIPIRIALQRRRGGRDSVSFSYRVPRSTRPGRRTLTLRGPVPYPLFFGGGGDLGLLLEGGGGAGIAPEESIGPRSVEELASRIAMLERRGGLRATFARKGRGPVVLPTKKVVLRGRLRVPMLVVGPP